jgi:hypothetical protein
MIASAASTWAIVIVVVPCLIFWLSAVSFAARSPYHGNSPPPRMNGPVLGGMHLSEGGRSVAPDRDAPAELTDEEDRQLRRSAATRPYVPSQGMPGMVVTTAREPSQAPALKLPDPRSAVHDQQADHRPR